MPMSQERFERMRNGALALRIAAAVFLLVVCGCPRQRAQPPSDEPRMSEPGTQADLTPEVVLGNMPTNSDERCVGISLVMEALLDGKLASQQNNADKGDDLAKLAGEI